MGHFFTKAQSFFHYLIRYYLHSTMLLLYPWQTSAGRLTRWFTFHYASTLSIWDSRALCTFSCNLHSTMLLLYRSRFFCLLRALLIYIPLCFYFIWHDRIIRRRRSHLQSTMLLLYQVRTGRKRYLISFTFHYASTLSNSPLGNALNAANKFTFHYASTLSKYRAHSMSHGWLFTFHYASTLSEFANQCGKKILIYIPLCFYFIAVVPPMSSAGSGSFTFHYASTLSHVSVLLISCILIYIPLCFYFIWVTGYDINDYDKFTFHYASTLSLSERYNIVDDPHLHSTMLLLYRIWRTDWPGQWSAIYIPLCFYFIDRFGLVNVVIEIEFTFHYASTLSCYRLMIDVY